jgi:UDP-N-acetyl-D-galactosamine dehydrogenase
VLGVTFKEDVPDLRNTRVVDIIAELEDYGITVLSHDPLADPTEAKTYYGLDLVSEADLKGVDAVVLAVIHEQYRQMGLGRMAGLCPNGNPILVDVKAAFSPAEAAEAGIAYWRL